MKHISATARIAFSLVCLLSCLLLTGKLLGMIPDDRVSIMHGRSNLCEAMAINCSLLATQNDLETMEAGLHAIAMRNPDVLSVGVRRDDGRLLAEIGKHSAHWRQQARSTTTQMFVPIFNSDQQWGTVEVRFLPLSNGVFSWLMADPSAELIVFVLSSSLLVFYFYLRMVLRQLNPSKVVPGRVRDALDALAEGLMIVDKNERIVLANQAFAKTAGADSEELVGKKASHLSWLASDESARPPWSQVLAEGEQQRGAMLEMKNDDGSNRTFMVNSTPIRDANGKSRGALASFEDITPLKEKQAELSTLVEQLQSSSQEIHRQNEELKRLATRDPLTGCLNRRSFFERFETVWSASTRYDQPCSCVMLDIDHFKSINDNCGHSAGDEVLKRVGSILQTEARDSDVVCRYGGEEFAILLPHTETTEAAQAAEKFRRALAAERIAGLPVTASLGVSSIEFGASDPQQLLDQADKCLYAAKRNGRNQVVRFDDVPDDLEVDEKQLSREAPDPNVENAHQSIPFHAVTALISALAYRDQSTASHSRRVADLAVACAEGLMTLSECYVLEIAALLHDIGKIGVPDSILLKPGPLTRDEWQLMEKHDRIGVEIIRASFNCPELSEIVENHHAFFGGGGGHPGLPTGTDIPVGGRILAIADAYDAITSDRVYRAGRDAETAFTELRRCAGSQFDPELVERFIGIVQLRSKSDRAEVDGVSKETALRIGLQLERLAETLDNQDLDTLNVIAERLHQTGKQSGIPELASRARQLQHQILSDSDILEIFSAANNLMELCRDTQKSYLDDLADSARDTVLMSS